MVAMAAPSRYQNITIFARRPLLFAVNWFGECLTPNRQSWCIVISCRYCPLTLPAMGPAGPIFWSARQARLARVLTSKHIMSRLTAAWEVSSG
jgi:hypothetical protein